TRPEDSLCPQTPGVSVVLSEVRICTKLTQRKTLANSSLQLVPYFLRRQNNICHCLSLWLQTKALFSAPNAVSNVIYAFDLQRL
uniref:Prokineticin domain-containing protein n=1 Tax=Periophthalmus magnuspinnatus TaxID=409849 RepID=A0A3B4APA5_9GOBI